MPNVPEMSQVWMPEWDAINLVVEGKGTPQVELRAALKQIRAGIAQMHVNR